MVVTDREVMPGADKALITHPWGSRLRSIYHVCTYLAGGRYNATLGTAFFFIENWFENKRVYTDLNHTVNCK